jgi:predicted DNA-binding transcriptional regulator AlpA
MSGIVKLVHRIEDDDGPFFTIGEVAERLGKSRDTIKRWVEENDDLVPERHQMPLGEPGGKSFVWLYTEDDIRRMEEFSSTIKMGRPPKNRY